MLLLAWAAIGAELVVAPGDDLAALTSSLRPGDQVVFAEGLYPIAGTLDWSHVGTENEPIVLEAQGAAVIDLQAGGPIVSMVGAEFVSVRGLVFQGSGLWETTSFDALYIADSHDLLFEDVLIRDIGDEGFDLEGVNARITIRRTEIANSSGGFGIYAGCDDATCATQESVFENNWIHDLMAAGAYGVYLAHGCNGVTLRDNVVHDVAYGGIGAGSTEYGPAHTIEGNVVWAVGTEASGGVGLALSGPAIVRNNLVFQVFGWGIWTGSAAALSDLVVSFNTVSETTLQGFYANEPWVGRSGMVLTNNAIVNPTGYAARFPTDGIDAGARVVGNRFTGLVEGMVEGFDSGGGTFDFVDPTASDYYPSTASSLRDAADPAGESWVPGTDFNGAARDGLSPDVGAYEYGGSVNPGWSIEEGFKEVGVVAADDGAEVGGCGHRSGSAAVLAVPWLLLSRRRRA